MSGGSAADIRRSNLFDVLRRVAADAPVSRQQLTASTGLSLATVASLVSDMLGRGVLLETEPDRSGPGRPLTRVRLNPAHGCLIGVDVAETYIHAELYDTALARLAEVETRVGDEENDPQSVADQIVSAVRTLLADAGGSEVLGVGVSVPGLVDNEGGASLYAPNWNWHAVPLRDLLQKGLSLPLYLDNPLKALTVSELWSGSGPQSSNLVVVNLGTGIGAGIAIRGALYRGTTNCAGEWGHATVQIDGRPCRCGGRGCLEAYVGARGIMAHLREVAPDSPLLNEHDQRATIAAIGEALQHGDDVAAEVVRRTGRYLGAGLANLVNIMNPERIVLTGWVTGMLGEALRSAAEDQLRSQALAGPREAVRIGLRWGTGNPVSRGAATLALEGSVSGNTEGTR